MRVRIGILLFVSAMALSLLLMTYVFPISFSGVQSGFISALWLFVSNSGGVVGVPIISLIFCLFIAYYFEGWRKRMVTVTISLVVFASLLGSFAKLNESIIKEYVKLPRPYALFLKSNYNFQMDKFYLLEEKEARRAYLNKFIKGLEKNKIQYKSKEIDPEVINHWLVETGFSFPSGHTVNSFLMAFIIGYVILFIYQDYRRKIWFVAPYIWAVSVALSRIAVGAHSTTDIVLGAFMGTFFGVVIISTRIIDKLMVQKQ